MSRPMLGLRRLLFFTACLVLGLLIELLLAALSVLIVLSVFVLPCSVWYLWSVSASSWAAWVLVITSGTVLVLWLWIGRGELGDALGRKARRIAHRLREKQTECHESAEPDLG